MIRSATLDDLNQIYGIYTSYCLDKNRLGDFTYETDLQKNGYMMCLESMEDISANLQTAPVFLVSDDSGTINGYLIAKTHTYFPEDAANATWLLPNTKRLHYHDERAITLHHVGVKRDELRSGIGSHLLETAEKQLIKQGYKHLFSIVSIGPLTNCASLVFHAKHRFQRACSTSPIDLFGFQNIQSLLFYKELN